MRVILLFRTLVRIASTVGKVSLSIRLLLFGTLAPIASMSEEA